MMMSEPSSSMSVGAINGGLVVGSAGYRQAMDIGHLLDTGVRLSGPDALQRRHYRPRKRKINQGFLISGRLALPRGIEPLFQP